MSTCSKTSPNLFWWSWILWPFITMFGTIQVYLKHQQQVHIFYTKAAQIPGSRSCISVSRKVAVSVWWVPVYVRSLHSIPVALWWQAWLWQPHGWIQLHEWVTKALYSSLRNFQRCQKNCITFWTSSQAKLSHVIHWHVKHWYQVH
jgi:hypothetical protein